jgi:hypothetical protein
MIFLAPAIIAASCYMAMVSHPVQQERDLNTDLLAGPSRAPRHTKEISNHQKALGHPKVDE